MNLEAVWSRLFLKKRTKKLATAIIGLVDGMPRTLATDALARQIVSFGTSIGENYRAVCGAKSTADMLKKLEIVEKENDETA